MRLKAPADLVKEISSAFRKNGLTAEARYVDSGIKSFTLDGENLTFIMHSKLALDIIAKRRIEEERIISGILGHDVHLHLDVFKEEELKYTEEVEYLRSLFKNTEVYEIKEENIRHESKPVRNDEAAREFGEPDESYEGGDF